jgi:hypothetical protein
LIITGHIMIILCRRRNRLEYFEMPDIKETRGEGGSR